MNPSPNRSGLVTGYNSGLYEENCKPEDSFRISDWEELHERNLNGEFKGSIMYGNVKERYISSYLSGFGDGGKVRKNLNNKINNRFGNISEKSERKLYKYLTKLVSYSLLNNNHVNDKINRELIFESIELIDEENELKQIKNKLSSKRYFETIIGLRKMAYSKRFESLYFDSLILQISLFSLRRRKKNHEISTEESQKTLTEITNKLSTLLNELTRKCS